MPKKVAIAVEATDQKAKELYIQSSESTDSQIVIVQCLCIYSALCVVFVYRGTPCTSCLAFHVTLLWKH